MWLFGTVLLLLTKRYVHVEAVTHVRRKAPVREKKAYDTNVRGFSPDGSIYQIEYAIQAADKGGLTIGVQTDQGLVLAAQGRRRSPLLKSSSVFKINDIDACISCAMSGLLPDGRMLVDYARFNEATYHGPCLVLAQQILNSTWVQEHRFEFDEAPSVEAVASHLSQLALKFHGYDKDGKPRSSKEEADGGAMARPVGVALLMAGVDRGNRPVLYHLDPSGAYMQWRAKAIGEKGAAAEAMLEKCGPYGKMTVRRAMVVVLQVLKEVLGDEFCEDRLEMVCVDLSEGDTDLGEIASLSAESRQYNSQVVVDEGRSTAALDYMNRFDAIGTWDRSKGLEEVDKHGGGKDNTSMSKRRWRSFRRVPRSELEDLVRDGATSAVG